MSDRDALHALPVRAVPAGKILNEIHGLRHDDLPTHGGRLFAYVYDPAVDGLDDLALAAYGLSAHVNGLDPTAFPSLLAMENAIVGAVAAVLGGGPSGVSGVVGNLTSGGTESLILAVKAARDARPDIAEPTLVVPETAHAAFAKAASYLRVRLVTVPVSPITLRPDTTELTEAIGPSTVLVACSAPAYPYGVVDPVSEIAEAALARGVRCHVDACFGGWILPFLRRLGEPVPAFDFSVPGVSSLSIDLHKYGYCPKGVSVLLHRDELLRMPQYFAWADWPGYTMVNATIASTRSGGPIAAAYATMRFLGEDGYLTLARSTLDAVRGLSAAVAGVPGLRLMPDTPQSSSVVVFTSTDADLDLFVLADELTLRGWHTQPQLRSGALPRSIHLTVTASVAPQVAEFAADLRDAAAAARAHGAVVVDDAMRSLVGSLNPADLTPSTVESLAAGLGLSLAGRGSPMPSRQADLNALLDIAPPALREALFISFLSLLQRPTW